MKKVKFFVKLISLLAVAALLLYVLNSVYVRGYYYNDIYGEVKKFQTEIPYGIRICNFGSSHGLASFKYEDRSDAFNFALSGEDLYHNYAKLQQYADHLEEGCAVFLPVSYFSFCTDTKAPSDKRYYMFLEKKYIKGYSLETYLNVRYFPVLRSGDGLLKDMVNEDEMAALFNEDNPLENNIGRAFSDLYANRTGYLSASQTASLNPENAYNSDYYPQDSELYDFSDLRSKSWHSQFNRFNIYMDENVEILTDMVEFCMRHNFMPILVSTPINHVLNDMFTDEELQVYFYGNIEKVRSETGVEFWDYSHDPAFSDNNGYFSNADHFNSQGGKAFTEEIMKRLDGFDRK
ncbi:MAG: hypothetical protein IJT91_04270 [Clostridia bacterium]|nr:hypothetical protein [Clostridia bacterium]